MPPTAWAYVAGGAGEGRTMGHNRQAFERWRVVPRMLHGITQRDLTASVLGTKLSAPLLLAPIGAASLVAANSDVIIATDEALVDSMIKRAEDCGAGALVVTLDTTILGWRPQDLNLGSWPFVRGHGIAQYTSDPRFLEIVQDRIASLMRRTKTLEH